MLCIADTCRIQEIEQDGLAKVNGKGDCGMHRTQPAKPCCDNGYGQSKVSCFIFSVCQMGMDGGGLREDGLRGHEGIRDTCAQKINN